MPAFDDVNALWSSDKLGRKNFVESSGMGRTPSAHRHLKIGGAAASTAVGGAAVGLGVTGVVVGKAALGVLAGVVLASPAGWIAGGGVLMLGGAAYLGRALYTNHHSKSLADRSVSQMPLVPGLADDRSGREVKLSKALDLLIATVTNPRLSGEKGESDELRAAFGGSKALPRHPNLAALSSAVKQELSPSKSRSEGVLAATVETAVGADGVDLSGVDPQSIPGKALTWLAVVRRDVAAYEKNSVSVIKAAGGLVERAFTTEAAFNEQQANAAKLLDAVADAMSDPQSLWWMADRVPALPGLISGHDALGDSSSVHSRARGLSESAFGGFEQKMTMHVPGQRPLSPERK